MSAMITFAADLDGFRKRKRVHKACEPCRKRRKRCSHVFFESEGQGGHVVSSEHMRNSSVPGDDSPEAEVELRRHDNVSNGVNTARLVNAIDDPDQGEAREGEDEDASSQEPGRFVGYLSPEAQLRGQSQGKPGTTSDPSQHYCGHWVGWQQKSRSGLTGGLASSTPVSIIVDPEDHPVARNLLKAYLNAIGVNIKPPREHQDALVQIYFDFIHPVLPLVDEGNFRSLYIEGTEPRLLLQTMCIIAAKHDQARGHLYLEDSTKLYAPRDFSKKLFMSATAALEAKLETDRITLIQSLALLSLHGEGFDGAEQASMHLAQAIHHAHTMGLQFGRKQDTRGHGLETLFWCLWGLDKLNACINGRPLLMHDRDKHIPKPQEKSEARTPFGIWLQLADALDKVICYYRPGLSADETGWEENFPSFEDIIGDGGDSLNAPILAFLELFYHAVAMASHRSMAINDPIKATSSYTRQSLSAVRVVSILKDESPDNLPPLPIVPYALSLAASTAYRRFRQSKLQTHKNRGKEDLKRCCELLDKLRIAFWSAGATADLGKAALSKANSHGKTNQEASKRAGSELSAPPAASTRNKSITSPANKNANPPALDAHSVSDPDVASTQALNSLQTPGLPVASLSDETLSLPIRESPDWLNFDHAFENMDTLLGSSGADESSYLLRPFSYDTNIPDFFGS